MIKILMVSFLFCQSATASDQSKTEAGVPGLDEPCNCGLANELTPIEIQKLFLKTRAVVKDVYTDPQSSLCESFYENACAKNLPSSSQGSVRPFVDTIADTSFFKQDQELLRRLSQEWKSLAPSSKTVSEQQYIVTKFMETHDFSKKLRKFEQILFMVKADLVAYFEKNFEPNDLVELKERIQGITINKDYQNNPGLLFENTVYARDAIGVGGAFLRTVEDEHAIYFNLAHELAHLISYIGSRRLPEVKKCIQDKYGLMSFVPNVNPRLDEIWADWLATQLLAIKMKSGIMTQAEKSVATKNALRFFCGYGGSRFGHPSGLFRIGSVAEHEEIREQICPPELRKMALACKKDKK